MTSLPVYLAYAKINLYLEVLNKRRDGYHNLETIFQSVSLGDRLEFFPQPEKITLECDNEDLAGDASNLVVRAAQLLQTRFGVSQGVHIRLSKRIPIAAGLAGGSADAAATLVALNQLWDLKLTLYRLTTLGLELGSDVPFCLVGGTKAGRLRGQDLHAMHSPVAVWYLLVHPNLHVSTRDVFTSPLLRPSGEIPFAGWTCSFRKARRRLEDGDFAGAMFNRLEYVVFSKHPELASIKERLLRAGSIAAGMSGSGPTMFGVFRSREEAEKAAHMFSDINTSVVCPTLVGVNCLEG
ncbi:MAG TPA: 4-(cytidine 5'-diphospho)-2-C-methyl-D-erythritol kinase [Candidatus Hydrogenedentes bacterium]|nr:4-(cytidine 5'-diphospho)-2-C-methyl-D-erythritol kinase [Candidatus Hydrogenedentota bacterium]HOL76125.1 4-(cytidine 5'-diphospho)-2-C-methyl-D-erythritol kinase [Candidatus Hydrogenedentota bacterium]HPO84739.1 4-(cytidine 5'-diphospho)-2-C-methyl-D-erythritol kinase [Candidatus Hydrogenedentota bacterium]